MTTRSLLSDEQEFVFSLSILFETFHKSCNNTYLVTKLSMKAWEGGEGGGRMLGDGGGFSWPT